MNNQQVIAALGATQNAFSNLGPGTIDVGKVAAFLQKGVDSITAQLQLAMSCEDFFVCNGFKSTELIAQQIEVVESFGMCNQVAALRELAIAYEGARKDGQAGWTC